MEPRCERDGAWRVSRKALAKAGRDVWLGEHVAGRYGVIEQLGMGGMGAVYRAIDSHTGDRVAIKFLREQYASHPSIRMRFIREAEAGASVDSPYVVPLLDFGVEADRTLWLVMEHVQGHTLRDEVNRNGPFTVEQIVRLARQVLLGLASAHDAGLIHRDLKHDNIMFSGTRERFIARVLDFGVVKSEVADRELAESSGPLTGTGVMVGSPSYMSPEQIRGLEVGPPADLYAVAVVMYEALAARRLFSASNYESLLRRGAQREAAPLTHTGTGEPVPEALDRVIRRALAHDPDERYADARTMLLALEQMELDLQSPPHDLFADEPEGGEPLESQAELTAVDWVGTPVSAEAIALSDFPSEPSVEAEAEAEAEELPAEQTMDVNVLERPLDLEPRDWRKPAIFTACAVASWVITRGLLT